MQVGDPWWLRMLRTAPPKTARLPILLAASAMLFAATAGGTARLQDQVTSKAGNPRDGQSLYVRKGCYQCHGYVGQGALWVAPKLVPQRLSEDQFSAYIRKPSGAMPAYSESLLSGEELHAIHTFLEGLPGGREAADIAILSPLAQTRSGGRAEKTYPDRPVARSPGDAPSSDKLGAAALYQTQCAACHGAQMQGGTGPNLISTARTASQIAASIRQPPPSMPRLYPTPLSDEQAEAIAAYVQKKGAAR